MSVVHELPVRIVQEGALLVISINRPQVRNAIDRATSLLIAGAMDRLDADASLQVGILTGLGGHFSAGMDLKAFLQGERVEIEGRGLAGITQRPPQKPLIAAVEGYALAGGFELALACDLIVAADNAQFGIPEVRRGLIAGSGGLLRLPQRIPRQIAAELALTGRMMTAMQAQQWGLVNRLTAPGAALDGARALGAEIAANGPLAVSATKRLLAAAAEPSAGLWQQQGVLLEAIVASNDAREGALAFSEKRVPQWSAT